MSRFPPSTAALLSLVLVAIAAPAARLAAQAPGDRLALAPGIALRLPAGWSEVQRMYGNARVLTALPGDRQGEQTSPWRLDHSTGAPPANWTARALVIIEQRRSGEEAQERLIDISLDRSGEIDWSPIGGHAALRRRASGSLPPKREAPAPPAVFHTLAVAVGDRIVRLEVTLPPAGEAALAPALDLLRDGLELPAAASTPPSDLTARARLRPALQPLAARRADAPLLTGEPLAPQGAPGTPVFARSGAETEVAASADGQFVVVSAQNRYAASPDGGVTYPFTGSMPFANYGDPSLAWGASGNFYYAGIRDTCNPSNNGCSTGIAVSTDNGQTFNLSTNATDCPADPDPAACFPDQEHIAADRWNLNAGQDQVYSVWRDFAGSLQPAIVCSANGGASWTAKAAVGVIGDWPRVTVGSDGFVYVVYATSPPGLVFLQKFSSCASGLAPQPGFPVLVSLYNGVLCPLAGNDRCDGRQTAASFQPAVDDTDPSHVYVAFANATAVGNEDILVYDSVDGGATFARVVAINGGGTGKRYFPWICTVDGVAYVGWNDRRQGAIGPTNDLVEYYLASAFVSGGNLVAGPEVNVFGVADPACASGWPCAADLASYAESCTVQPQLAGRCSISGNPCDFSDGCPAGQGTCDDDRGCPKYGDYDGIACGGGWVFPSWPSATPPPGVGTVPDGINTYMNALLQRTPADLRIDKVDSADPMAPLQDFVYTLTVQNLSPTTLARQLVVSDPLPASLVFRGLATNGWDCTTPPVGSTGTVTCTLNALAGGASAPTIQILVQAPQGGGIASNTASVQENPADPASGNNSSTEVTTIIAPDVAVTAVADSPDPALPLAQITWTITVENQGPTLAKNLVLSDPLPGGAAFVGAAGPGWNCAGPPIGTTGTVDCQLASLAAGAVAGTITIAATAPDAILDLVNVVTVNAETVDPDPSDNSAMAVTAVRSPSDVSGTKVVTTPPWAHHDGGAVEWSIVLSNAGPGAQFDNPGNEFEDVVDDFLTVTEATATLGTAEFFGNLVTWNGKLPAGQAVEIFVHADASHGGALILNQGSIFYDADGDGTNEALRLTDDPGQPGEQDPTPVEFLFILEIPTLGRLGLALLALVLAFLSARRLARRRRASLRS